MLILTEREANALRVEIGSLPSKEVQERPELGKVWGLLVHGPEFAGRHG